MGDFDLGLLDDDTYKVEVLRTKMLGIAEVFTLLSLPSPSMLCLSSTPHFHSNASFEF